MRQSCDMNNYCIVSSTLNCFFQCLLTVRLTGCVLESKTCPVVFTSMDYTGVVYSAAAKPPPSPFKVIYIVSESEHQTQDKTRLTLVQSC